LIITINEEKTVKMSHFYENALILLIVQASTAYNVTVW